MIVKMIIRPITASTISVISVELMIEGSLEGMILLFLALPELIRFGQLVFWKY